MKRGYFVVEHDIDSVAIYFIEECERTYRLISDLVNNVEEEVAIEKWNEFNEELEDGLNVFTERWDFDEEWPFNGYDIIDAVPLFIY
jgi:hypothetical protein